MEIRTIRAEEFESARHLLLAEGWDRGVNSPEKFSMLLSKSSLALVAVDCGEVLGFLRALTDGLANGYISMVVVAETHRGKGIGRSLVRSAIGDNDQMTWVLRAARTGVPAFYKKLGFSQSAVAMERTRARVGGSAPRRTKVRGLDHVQVAMPRGAEAQAREFYGTLLGLEEIPKPTELAARGGAWFRCGQLQLHLGVEDDFRAAKKAHPAFLVDDLQGLVECLTASGYAVQVEQRVDVERAFTADPFGNRVELVQL